MLSPTAARAEAAPGCPAGDLLANAEIVRSESVLDPWRITDGRIAPAGESPLTDATSALTKPTAEIVYRLAEPATITAFFLEADADDYYHVSLSMDGRVWTHAWQAPAIVGHGQQIRAVTGDGKIARFVRLHDPYGDAPYGVAEFAAYCTLPDPWPPEFTLLPPARPPPVPAPSARPVVGFKIGIGLLALAAFCAGRRTLPATGLARRAAFIGLCLAGFLCWSNLLDFQPHTHDAFHHYLSAKYFPELGQYRLYECAALAEAEGSGPGMVRERILRDPESYRVYSPPRSLADRELCKSHFSEERWSDFRADVRFFRGEINARHWHELLFRDQGFNATPMWTAIARWFTFSSPLTEKRLLLVSAIDPLVYGAIFALFAWAFGLETAALAAVAWGVGYPYVYAFTGGAFLRTPWLLFSVLAVCLLKKGRPFWGGMSLGIAALLQLFPALFALGGAAQAVRRAVAERRLPRFHLWAAAGLAAAVALGVPTMELEGAGARNYVPLVAKLLRHVDRQFTTNWGLKTPFAYRRDNAIEPASPGDIDASISRYIERRNETFAKRKPFYAVAALALALFGLRFAMRSPPWAAVAVGPLFVFAFVEASNYYYVMILLLAPLAMLRRELRAVYLVAAVIDLVVASTVYFPQDASVLQACLFLLLSLSLLLVPVSGALIDDERR